MSQKENPHSDERKIETSKTSEKPAYKMKPEAVSLKGSELLKKQDMERLNLKDELKRRGSEVRKETKEKIANERTINLAIDIRSALQKEIGLTQQVISMLHEKETGSGSLKEDFLSKKGYFNFISPENAFGLAGLINGETFTGSQLETLRHFNEESNRNLLSLSKIIARLRNGESLENMRKDHLLLGFFETPEGRFFSDTISGQDADKITNNYYLNKARKLKSSGEFKSEYLAQAYYDKLKGTQYEEVAKKEGLTKGQKGMKALTDFGNAILTMDQLVVFAAGGSIGRFLAKVLSKGPVLAKGMVATNELVGASKSLTILSKLIPGVTLFKNQVGEGVLKIGGKLLLNLGIEATKFTAIIKMTQKAFGEEVGHMLTLALMIIPGAREGFLNELYVKIGKNASAGGEFASYMLDKYGRQGTKDLVEQALKEKAMKMGNLDEKGTKAIKELSDKVTNALGKIDERTDGIRLVDGRRVSTGVADSSTLEANATRSEKSRIMEAERLVGRKLEKHEEEALLEAHGVPQEEKVRKGKILMSKGKFSRDEAQILMDQNLAGKSVEINVRKPAQKSEMKYHAEFPDVSLSGSFLSPIESGVDGVKITGGIHEVGLRFLNDFRAMMAKEGIKGDFDRSTLFDLLYSNHELKDAFTNSGLRFDTGRSITFSPLDTVGTFGTSYEQEMYNIPKVRFPIFRFVE